MIRITPIITNIAPIILIGVIFSPKNMHANTRVTRGELDIIIVTNDTSPFLMAAKYARSPTNVANTASMAISIHVQIETLFIWNKLPLTSDQQAITPAANSVLNTRPTVGFKFFNAILAKIGAIPQHIIPKSDRRKTGILPFLLNNLNNFLFLLIVFNLPEPFILLTRHLQHFSYFTCVVHIIYITYITYCITCSVYIKFAF